MAGTGDRHALLTDAAIAVVAASGMRGLTHRAVDARAGIAQGSTSAYFRTRKALIEAMVHRLADLDRDDLGESEVRTDGPLFDGSRPVTQLDLEQLTTGIAHVIDTWLSAGRERTLARYACLLEATHHPELRTILQHGVAFREQARALLAAAGAPDAERRGDLLVAAVDGLLFDRLVGAGALSAPPPGTAESRDDLQEAVRVLLAGALQTGPA